MKPDPAPEQDVPLVSMSGAIHSLANQNILSMVTSIQLPAAPPPPHIAPINARTHTPAFSGRQTRNVRVRRIAIMIQDRLNQEQEKRRKSGSLRSRRGRVGRGRTEGV